MIPFQVMSKNNPGLVEATQLDNSAADTQTNEALLRYFVPVQGRDKHLNEMIRTCEKIGSKEVLLYTSDYMWNEIFITGDALKERIDHLQFCAERIQNEGLTFSLNAMHTLGHLFVPDGEIKKFGFQRQLDVKGNPGRNPGQIDPSCPNLQENLSETYKQYATLKPRLLFVDDDYKVPFAQCFVPARVTQFARQWGCKEDRSIIANLLASDDGNTRRRARELMFELVSNDLANLATILQKASHAESSTTRLGVMLGGFVVADVQRIVRAFAGPHKPYVRPSLGSYREEIPVTSYVDSWWQLNYWKARLGEEFEFYPECEHFPYCTSLKSSAAAYAHMATILGEGELKVALSLNSFSTVVPACDSPILVDYFESLRGQVGTVTRVASTGGKLEGVALWNESESVMLGIESPTAPSALLLKGVPGRVAAGTTDADVIWGQSVLHATDQEIENLLARGALIDTIAAEALDRRGFASKIGLENHGRCELSDLLHLRLEREEGDYELWPFYYFVSRLEDDLSYPFKWKADGAMYSGEYMSTDGQPAAPFVMRWTSPSGVKFSLINLDMKRMGNRLVSPWADRDLIAAVEWIRPLPARVIDSRNTILKCLNIGNGEGYLCTLCNLSTGVIDGVKIQFEPKLMSSFNWSIVLKNGKLEPLKIREKNIINLKSRLECLEVAFIYGEMKE